VTSHRGHWPLLIRVFIVVGVDVACRQCTECWVLPWKYNLQCCQAAKYLALLLTTISVQYYEFVSLLFGMKNVRFYCNSKIPKTFPKTYTWSGTFILKDGRYTVFFSFLLLHECGWGKFFSWVWRTKKSVRNFRLRQPFSWALRSSETLRDAAGTCLLTFRDSLSVPCAKMETTGRLESGKQLPTCHKNRSHKLLFHEKKNRKRFRPCKEHVLQKILFRNFHLRTVYHLYFAYTAFFSLFFLSYYNSWILISSLRLAKAVTCSSRNYLVSTTVIALGHNIRQLPCFVTTCCLFQPQLLSL
jgi:hypothetical protein